LYNVFADAGVTVAQWVRTRRLMEFRRDLADPLMSGKSITQLATHRGLSDAGYYSRIFRETFGMTPTDWRNTSGNLGR
jgi:AraC-like DNA-binding protein